MRALYAALALVLVGACAGRPEPRPIGVATMREDRTIVLQLRAQADKMIGEALLEYGPSDPQYEAILDHVGPLEPGEEVPVLPFPEEPPP